ncbi:ABC transporter ATP-binding protein [Frankia sp. CNm7]|nr:ABC transporter ATP-binding protein [Frankia nepalensis]MBL7515362.1 ABC transporter ATP-binding protein [Frankia nepalensis]MBL7523079.1 ABC transporter ATP-binding protein [Frankia nepalensis]
MAAEPLLRVDDLRVDYRGVVAVGGVSLRVAEGQCVAVIGANGAGKTSLLRAVGGFVPAGAGSRVELAGVDLTRMPAHRRVRAGLGSVLENRHLFPHMTVRDNLELGAAAAPGRSGAGLRGALSLLPELEGLLDRRAATLSGGQQQFVAIGRALATEPRLLLLDEPTNGLAPRLVERVIEIVRHLRAAGTATLLVEQRLEVAVAITAEVHVLAHGRVVHSTDGDTADLARIAHSAYLS